MLVGLALTATLLVRPRFSTTFRHDSPESTSTQRMMLLNLLIRHAPRHQKFKSQKFPNNISSKLVVGCEDSVSLLEIYKARVCGFL